MSAGSLVDEFIRFKHFCTDFLGSMPPGNCPHPCTPAEARLLQAITRTGLACAPAGQLGLRPEEMGQAAERLVAAGLVFRREDGLGLTPGGEAFLAGLEAAAAEPIHRLASRIDASEQAQLIEALRQVRRSLSPGVCPAIVRSFRPADADWIIRRHNELYAQEYGFGGTFGLYVDRYVRQFVAGNDPAWENIWIAEVDGEPAGCIAIVRAGPGTAQLRWFLLEPGLRGKGIGHQLMRTVLAFCRAKGYRHVLLWTVDLLAAARHLYRVYGFTLTETQVNHEWRPEPVLEERWDLVLHE